MIDVLRAVDVSDIALHRASFKDVDGEAIAAGLGHLCKAAGPAADGEDPVQVFTIPQGAAERTREQALEALARWMQEGM